MRPGPAAGTPATTTLRPYRATDADPVLALINHDRLPGQPRVDAAMLAEAVAGRSAVDAGWWLELEQPRTDVLLDDTTGAVLGIVSYARRRAEDTGLLLWLHAREQPAALTALTTHATGRLQQRGCRRWEAFAFASALSLGLEGLPARHRHTTAAVLRAAGFTGVDLWRYLRRPLRPTTAPALPPGLALTVDTAAGHDGWELTMTTTGGRGPGEVVGTAEIGRPQHGIGVLWWITTTPTHRGRGLGRVLLERALAELAGRGAREAILFVDDDEPGSDRDRRAANRLYDAAGFTEVDRLWSFHRDHPH